MLKLLDQDADIMVFSFDEVVKSPHVFYRYAREKFGAREVKEFVSKSEFDSKVFNIVENMEKEDSGGVVRESHVARPSELRKSMAEEKKLEIMERENELDKSLDLYKKVLSYSN